MGDRSVQTQREEKGGTNPPIQTQKDGGTRLSVQSIRGVEIDLTLQVEKEDNLYVSFCEELGTASCGDTPLEALYNICEAVGVHVDTLISLGQMNFAEKGIVVRDLQLPSSDDGIVSHIVFQLPIPNQVVTEGQAPEVPVPETWILQAVNGRKTQFRTPVPA